MDDEHYYSGPIKSNLPVREVECELAPNGLLWRLRWLDAFEGPIKTLFFDQDYYAFYLEKEGIRAGNGLDKSEWEVVPCPEDFTYFARGTKTGRIKIGRSRNPKRRMNDLFYTQYERVELLAHIPDGGLEWYYLKAFSDHCIEGEWFAPHPDILAEIEWAIHDNKVNPPKLWGGRYD